MNRIFHTINLRIAATHDILQVSPLGERDGRATGIKSVLLNIIIKKKEQKKIHHTSCIATYIYFLKVMARVEFAQMEGINKVRT